MPRTPTSMREEACEQALLARARSGDRTAFDELVRQHFGIVYSVTFRMVGNHEDAEDLAQDCFVRAFKSLQWYRAEAAFSTWLQRIAAHLALDHLRGRARRATESRFDAPSGVTQAEQPVARTEEPGSGEFVHALSAALDRLPPRLRAAIVLRTLEEKEYVELARILGVKPSTGRMLVMQARKRLLRLLEPWLGGASR